MPVDLAKSCHFSLLSLGDELVQGKKIDTNSPWLAHELVELGMEPEELCTLDDGVEHISAALLRLAGAADVVLITGGLGPTLDDVTREAVASAAGVGLAEDADALAWLTGRFQEMGRDMAASNLRQVLFPEGARVLPNEMGTAPGFHMTIGTTEVFALPGPPREMKPMFRHSVVPILESLGKSMGLLPRARFYLHSTSESVFAEQVHSAGNWMARDADPLVAVTASHGVLSVQLTARDRTEASTHKLEQRARDFRALFGDFIYSEAESRPAFALGATIIAAGLQVTMAESCTGGGIAAALTDVPGISAVFERSYVTYSNAAKHSELGVPEQLLEAHGAVSPEVVAAMAQGAAERAGADLALSVSGIAGPGGGSELKPVGLVWFGIYSERNGVVQSSTVSHRFPNADRAQVRTWAVRTGLMLLLQAARDLAKK
jgi:nicotinamide-nucleotide amidase